MIASVKHRKGGERISNRDRLFYLLINLFVGLLTLMVLYPLIYIVSSSFSSPAAVSAGKVTLWPVDFSLRGYQAVFEYKSVFIGYRNTIFYTVVGTLFNLFLTLPAAYALSKKELPLRNLLMGIFVFTMYFGGGMIPSYLLLNSLKLLNTEWCLVLPGAISTYNMILMRTYFSSIPDALRESATIDGANDFVTLTRIMLPLSKSMLATIALFYAVGRWNAVTDGMIYINEPEKYILQVRLKNIILNAQGLDELMAEGDLAHDVLKVPHHGKRHDNNAAFFRAVSPRYAVITSSDDDPEKEETVHLLEEAGAAVLLTRLGDVTITSDGKNLTVTQAG